MIDYYDKEGNAMTLEEWGEKLEDSEYKVVAQKELPNEKWISTVWLGLNHGFGDGGPPLIFETMVFPKKGEYGELDMDRYSTLEEAEAGHKKMVEEWTNK